MAEWEIVQMYRRGWSKVIYWWEARQATPQGEVTIAKSPEFLDPSGERGWLLDFLGTFVGGHVDDIQIWQKRRLGYNEPSAKSEVGGQVSHTLAGWKIYGIY